MPDAWLKASHDVAGRVDVVRMLLQAGADKTIRSTSGKTAPDLAVQEEKADCARVLRDGA